MCSRSTHGVLLHGLLIVLVATTGAASLAAQEPSFTPIPPKLWNSLSTWGQGISADGEIAVGVADGVVWRWTETDGVEFLSYQNWYETFRAKVSADGSTIVSTVDDGTGTYSAALYTDDLGWTNLGGLPGSPDDTESTGYGINGDGTAVVGLVWTGSWDAEAFLWTAADGMVSLGSPATANSRANDISDSGSVVVGWWESETTGCRRPARWIDGGPVDLFLGDDICGEANAVSADGTVVVGQAVVPGVDFYTAFRFSDVSGWIDLGKMGSSETAVSLATGIAENGTIVGLDGSEVYGIWRGFIWTPLGGMRLLSDYFTDIGVDYFPYGIREVREISLDGATIIGSVSNTTGGLQGFVATIPAPTFSDGFEFGTTDMWSTSTGGGF